MPAHLVLASASPQRKELLEKIGFSVKVMPSNIEEDWKEGENPESYVKRMSRMKVVNVVERIKQTLYPPETDLSRGYAKETPLRWVLGADTVVVYENEVMLKPKDIQEATEMLQNLSGSEHLVITGFCLYDMKKHKEGLQSVTTSVKFKKLSRQEIEKYLSLGEAMDKSGAYSIQGVAGYFVDSINGSYTNVIGLPLCQIIEMMEELGAYDILPYSVK